MLEMLSRRAKGRELVSRLRLLPAEIDGSDTAIDVPVALRVRMGVFGWSFFIAVVFPALIAFLYFSLIESNEYVSEAHFTVRKGSESKSAISDVMSGISASMGMGGIGTSSTTQDVFIVADYIRSRTIIEDLGGKQVLYNAYSGKNADWLSRLSSAASLEKAWKYWNRKVSAVIDTPSGIITLDVRAFTPDDAQGLARLILTKSEALVNDISERSRRDAMTRALSEIKSAEDRLRLARAELADFRNKNNLIDPMLSAKTINDNIGKLLQDRSVLENNRATLGSSVSADSPMLRVLNAQIAALDQQISDLRSQLTSQSKGDALSGQIAGYESRQIEVQFAEKLYSIAQDAYNAARREQERQQLYLVTVEQPSTPEKPTYPRIFLDTMTVFAACLVLWSMGALLVASVRDHTGG